MAKVRLAGDIAGFVELSAPDTAGNNTIVLPDSNGSANQVLVSNGSGALSWTSQISAASVSGSSGVFGTITGTSGSFVTTTTATGNISELRFNDSDSSNWVALKSAATVTGNVTWILPEQDGTSGQVLQTNGSGSFGWTTPLPDYTITVTATGKTLASRERCTVTASGQTLTLPASPSVGNEVTVTIAGTFLDTVIARNGSNIMSLAENLTVDKPNISVTLYYVDATRGWRII